MGVHDDHRKRVRKEFIANGPDSFEVHKLMEMLLYYGIPRIDTNVIAHRLIASFGSFRDVMDAKYEELLKVDGIGESSAILIKLVAEVSRRYALAEHADIIKYDTVEKVGRFLTALFAGQADETAYLLLFNGRQEMIGVVEIGTGHVSSVLLSARAVIENALDRRASGIVLAHNHPFGIAAPSGDDIELSCQLDFLCHQLGVSLMEHFVVSGNDYCPILRHKNRMR